LASYLLSTHVLLSNRTVALTRVISATHFTPERLSHKEDSGALAVERPIILFSNLVDSLL